MAYDISVSKKDRSNPKWETTNVTLDKDTASQFSSAVQRMALELKKKATINGVTKYDDLYFLKYAQVQLQTKNIKCLKNDVELLYKDKVIDEQWAAYTWEEIINLDASGKLIPKEVLEWAYAQQVYDIVDYEIISVDDDYQFVKSDERELNKLISQVREYVKRTDANEERLKDKTEELNKTQEQVANEKKIREEYITNFNSETEDTTIKLNKIEQKSLTGKLTENDVSQYSKLVNSLKTSANDLKIDLQANDNKITSFLKSLEPVNDKLLEYKFISDQMTSSISNFSNYDKNYNEDNLKLARIAPQIITNPTSNTQLINVTTSILNSVGLDKQGKFIDNLLPVISNTNEFIEKKPTTLKQISKAKNTFKNITNEEANKEEEKLNKTDSANNSQVSNVKNNLGVKNIDNKKQYKSVNNIIDEEVENTTTTQDDKTTDEEVENTTVAQDDKTTGEEVENTEQYSEQLAQDSTNTVEQSIVKVNDSKKSLKQSSNKFESLLQKVQTRHIDLEQKLNIAQENSNEQEIITKDINSKMEKLANSWKQEFEQSQKIQTKPDTSIQSSYRSLVSDYQSVKYKFDISNNSKKEIINSDDTEIKNLQNQISDYTKEVSNLDDEIKNLNTVNKLTKDIGIGTIALGGTNVSIGGTLIGVGVSLLSDPFTASIGLAMINKGTLILGIGTAENIAGKITVSTADNGSSMHDDVIKDIKNAENTKQELKAPSNKLNNRTNNNIEEADEQPEFDNTSQITNNTTETNVDKKSQETDSVMQAAVVSTSSNATKEQKTDDKEEKRLTRFNKDSIADLRRKNKRVQAVTSIYTGKK